MGTHSYWVYTITYLYKPGRELEGLCVPEPGIHYTGNFEMIIYSMWTCVWNRHTEYWKQRKRVGLGGAGLRGAWKKFPGLLGFLDSPSLAMSATENVVLEEHIKDLTRKACNPNVLNIPGCVHRHESFSTCVAKNKLRSQFRLWNWRLQ